MEDTATPADISTADTAPWYVRVPRSWLIAAGVLIAAILVVVLVWYPVNPQDEARKEAEKVVAAVSKLMVLPQGEEPIIATVADPSQLADQPFFSNAMMGDKVLIYNGARKAILYREIDNIIVDVAPLSPAQASPTPKR